jgi:hypothetical protein
MGSSSGTQLLSALALTATLLVALRFVFVAALPSIIAAKPAVSPEDISIWSRWIAHEHDGVETLVLFVGTFLFLLCAAGFSLLAQRHLPAIAKRGLWAAGLAATVFLVFNTRSSEFFAPAPGVSRWLWATLPAIVMAGWFAFHRRATKTLKALAATLAAAALLAFMVASLGDVYPPDYCYYIGPALRHLRGEALGTFYMQYNLGGTLLVEAMLAAGLKLHQIGLVFVLSLFVWFILYWLLARQIFGDSFFVCLFMAALVVVRFCNIRGHAAFVPQVLPLRLDLWVPILLVINRWGVRSWQASLSAGVVYFLDSTFGFLCVGVYCGALLLDTLLTKPSRLPWRQVLPSVAVMAWHLFTFGSIVSPAAKLYVNAQVGFLPTSPTSLFWPIALLLGWAIAIFVQRRQEQASQRGIVICAMALVHLTYFFGRSHDHNLLNVSGVWILAVLLSLHVAVSSLRARVGAAIVFVCLFLFMGAQQTEARVEQTKAAWTRGTWLREHPIENVVRALSPVVSSSTQLVELADAYLNYRLGLPQHGYFSPFEANLLKRPTIRFLDESLREGRMLLSHDAAVVAWVDDFNRNDLGIRFDVVRRGGLLQIVKRGE